MKLVMGSPGTWSGMGLRVSQCVFAAASVLAMDSALGLTNYSAFAYTNNMLQLQFLWSLALACVDIFSMRNDKDLHNLGVATLIVIGDWILALLIFSGASASASVMILFTRNMQFCTLYWRLACDQFALSVVLAFIVWSLDVASSFSVFWLMVSFF